MQPDEYQAAAMRTAGPALTDKDAILLTALGLCGEAGELADDLSPDELGDVWWYLARGATALRTTMDVLCHHTQYRQDARLAIHADQKDSVLYLFAECGKFSDYVKKAYFHSHTFKQSDGIAMLASIYARLERVTTVSGYVVEDVMQENVAKLKKRYPAGFTEEASRHRPEYLRVVDVSSQMD